MANAATQYGFLDEPKLKLDGLSGTFILLEDMHYRAASGRLFTVKAGLRTDFESRPTFLPAFVNWLLGDKNSTVLPALFHDDLYLRGPELDPPVYRKEADALYKEALAVVGKGFFSRNTAWLGLRLGGWYAWNSKERR